MLALGDESAIDWARGGVARCPVVKLYPLSYIWRTKVLARE